MAFNELEAMKMIDEGKISDKEIQLLSRLRNGVSVAEVEDDDEFEKLEEKGLVQRIALSHPRADISVDAVVPSEEGTTTLNLFDKRFRENTDADRDANTAPDVDPKMVKHPTDEEARKVPSLEMKPLEEDQKRMGFKESKETKEAMKDPLVAAGARNIEQAETGAERVITENAKVVVDGSKFDHDGDGKVGGSKKRTTETKK
jgi:hypothetical protein